MSLDFEKFVYEYFDLTIPVPDVDYDKAAEALLGPDDSA